MGNDDLKVIVNLTRYADVSLKTFTYRKFANGVPAEGFTACLRESHLHRGLTMWLLSYHRDLL
jgi:hypothetical protein